MAGYPDDYTYWIAYSFECSPPSVREILKLFAETYSPTIGFVFADLIDSMWMASGVNDPAWWQETYHSNLNIEEIYVTIGDGDVRVYRSNRAWMVQLQLELNLGNVSVGMPSPCKRLVGFG